MLTEFIVEQLNYSLNYGAVCLYLWCTFNELTIFSKLTLRTSTRKCSRPSRIAVKSLAVESRIWLTLSISQFLLPFSEHEIVNSDSCEVWDSLILIYRYAYYAWVRRRSCRIFGCEQKKKIDNWDKVLTKMSLLQHHKWWYLTKINNNYKVSQDSYINTYWGINILRHKIISQESYVSFLNFYQKKEKLDL